MVVLFQTNFLVLSDSPTYYTSSPRCADNHAQYRAFSGNRPADSAARFFKITKKPRD